MRSPNNEVEAFFKLYYFKNKNTKKLPRNLFQLEWNKIVKLAKILINSSKNQNKNFNEFFIEYSELPDD
jgi:hypothetical protein